MSYRFRVWHILAAIAALTLYASVNQAFRPLHAALYRLEGAERERARKAEAAKASAAIEAANRQKVLDQAKELQRQLDAAKTELFQRVETDSVQASEQMSRIIAVLRAEPIQRVLGSSDYTLAELRNQKPCTDLNPFFGRRDLTPQSRSAVQHLCVLTLAQFDPDRDHLRPLVALLFEQLALYNAWRQSLGIQRRYPVQHMTAYWRANAMHSRDGPVRKTVTMMMLSRIPGELTEQVATSLSAEETRQMLDVVYPLAQRYGQIARDIERIKDAHSRLIGVPPLIEE